MANLRYEEYDDALLVRAAIPRSSWSAVGSAIVAGTVVGLGIRTFNGPGFSTPLSFVAVLAVMALQYVAAASPPQTELRVTNLDYTSRSLGGLRIRQARSTPRIEVRWLEYREDTRGPEGGDPERLYAVLKHRCVCILPDLSEAQAVEVIERIAMKFPGFREQWRSHSAFGTNVISLGLDGPRA